MSPADVIQFPGTFTVVASEEEMTWLLNGLLMLHHAAREADAEPADDDTDELPGIEAFIRRMMETLALPDEMIADLPAQET